MTNSIRKIDRSVKLKASQLHPNPWNPYANKSDRLQQAIGESIGEFDQIQDIVCRPHPDIAGAYQILDGEGRHRTFKSDDDVYAIVMHGLTDAQAKKVTIVMDETRATADKIELASLLADLSTEYIGNDLISGLPYLQDELDELIKLSEIDWDAFNSDYSPTDSSDREQSDNRSTSFSFTLKDSTLKNYESVKHMISGEVEFKKNPNEAIVQLIEYLTSDYLKPNSKL
jgi:hypothetical protein